MYRTLRVLCIAAVLLGLAAIASAESKVRIVRLSTIEGTVQIDRATGQSFEKAFLNMPITEGVKLRTASDGRAEVEFEDGSTVRLTPNTTLQFTDMGLRDSGAKVSTIDVSEGMAYFEVVGNKDDEFLVTFGKQKIGPTRSTHFRVDVQNGSGEVAVLDGKVQVNGPEGGVEVSKNRAATFDLANDKYELAKRIVPDANDQWDKEQTQYSQRRTIANSYQSPYAYGWSDLAYYGAFSNVGGFGCWRPYFATLGWDPFMDGAWVYNPGFGYTFVSSYPWGWTPYHFGSWMYAGGTGWCWAPSYPGYGLIAYSAVPVIGPRRPSKYIPPRPPAVHSTAMVAVGRGPTFTALQPGSRRVAVRENSAGLGIPRSHVNLGKVEHSLNQKGMATVSVPPAIAVVPTPVPATGGAAAGGGGAGIAGGRANGMSHAGVQHAGPAAGMGRMSSGGSMSRGETGGRMSSGSSTSHASSNSSSSSHSSTPSSPHK